MQLLITGIVLLVALIFHELQIQNNTTTTVAFLDIGQGDATYISFTNGDDMLIDCARGAQVLDALGRVMSVFDHTISYLVITHPDADHYGGCIDVLSRFDVQTIIMTGVAKNDALYQSFVNFVEHEGATIRIIDAVQSMQIGDSQVTYLYPDHNVVKEPFVPGTDQFESNNTSIVMRLSAGNTEILFTGDAEKELEQYLVDTYADQLNVDILKVGHHGSKTSSIDAFLQATSPEEAIVSVGKDNSYGHPAPSVIKRVKKYGAEVWQTTDEGDILISIDKDSYDIE